MLFNSLVFLWIFLPALFALYFLAAKKYRNYILLIFSLIFYAWGEPKYILLMLISIIINYFAGRLIHKYRRKKRHKKTILAVALVVNLALLGFFKYFNFFTLNLSRFVSIEPANIALPIGISFYTFQIMSYLIDLYRAKIKVQKNPLTLALYISFFPQLIAGPIVRYETIEKQLKSRQETKEKFAYGIKRFTYGLAKKVLIADVLALTADTIFAAVGTDGLTAPVAWLGAFCYAFQIFFDFSGYSDMAIGLGSMFGFKFLENFNLPYISGSITEFWRRWHISLSSWFREYLYIPLGGNRKGKRRTYLNLWLVFLVTGIWDGAAWNFIFWGLFHGFFIFIERLGLKTHLDRHKIISHVYALLVILVGWVFFRAPGLKAALIYLKTMFLGGGAHNLPLYSIFDHRAVLAFIFAILLSGPAQLIWQKLTKDFESAKAYQQFFQTYLKPATLAVLLAICLMAAVSNTYSAFIYFRF